MSIASMGGKKPTVGKAMGKVGKSIGKTVVNETKPILVSEGKKQLKQGIQSMLESEQASGAGLKRGRGRPRKNPQSMVSTQVGGKRSLGKKLGAMMPDDLLEEGFKRGLEYARKQSKSGGKFHIGHIGKSIGKSAKKLSGNEYAQDFTAGTVGLGVGAATGNPMAGVAAGTGTKIAMDKASGGKRGGAATRGKLVGKIMREKGLSLAAASKYVKEHGLY